MSLFKILSYRRPDFSNSETVFIKRFIKPTGARPDEFGNHILKIGRSPKVLFSSHTDTVHWTPGRQKLQVVGGDIVLHKNEPVQECLGADCGTGVYIMLELIKRKVPGLYIFHRAEESGCQGSLHIAENTPEILEGINIAIAFDRRGFDSIVTHQVGHRTASDSFADQLAGFLPVGMYGDPTGSFTDTESYAALIPECTNLSVGYRNAHGKTEAQDIVFPNVLVRYIARNIEGISSIDPERTPAKKATIDWSKVYGGATYENKGYDYTSSDWADKYEGYVAEEDEECPLCWTQMSEGDALYYRLDAFVCGGCKDYIDFSEPANRYEKERAYV